MRISDWSSDVCSSDLLAARAVEAGVRHFVHVSSFAIHGRAELINDTTPIEPTGPYGASKAEGERALLGGSEAGSVSVVRLPMLYGDGNSKLARIRSEEKTSELP